MVAVAVEAVVGAMSALVERTLVDGEHILAVQTTVAAVSILVGAEHTLVDGEHILGVQTVESTAGVVVAEVRAAEVEVEVEVEAVAEVER